MKIFIPCIELLFTSVVFAMNNFADTNCGKIFSPKRTPKIVGGKDANEGEFPWLVSVTRRGGHFCGGSLLSNKFILTAGHCVCSGIGTDILNPNSIKVTLGQHNLSEKSKNSYEMNIKEITVHPEYKCTKPRNDIALLELNDPLEWSEFVSPVCLPIEFGKSGYQKFENVLATVAGWGWTSENSKNGGRAKILQKANVSIIESEKCQEWYKSQGKKTKIQNTQMCAGYEQGGIDSCWADSGGPLMVPVDGRVALIGVVSTGIGCARPFLPGLYTRVSEYIPWIRSIVN